MTGEARRQPEAAQNRDGPYVEQPRDYTSLLKRSSQAVLVSSENGSEGSIRRQSLPRTGLVAVAADGRFPVSTHALVRKAL